MVDVGSVNFSIVPNLSDLTAGLGEAKDKIDQFAEDASGSAKKATEGFGDLDGVLGKLKGFTPVGLLGMAGAAVGIGAVGIALGDCATKAVDFNKTLTDTSIKSGLSFDALKTAAETTGTSFTKSAAAENQLADAGLRGTQVTSALSGALLLAKASGQDLGAATDATANMILQFGQNASEAADDANLLMAASQSSNASIGDLEQGLAMIARSGHFASTLQEDTAALAMLKSAAIPTRVAAADLAGALSQMAKMNDSGPTKTQAAALAELGLQVSDLDPRVHSLSEITATLKEHHADGSNMVGIYGEKIAQAMDKVVNGSQSLSEMTSKIEGTSAATDAAARRSEEYGAKMDKMWASINNCSISLGEYLVPALGAAADAMIELIKEAQIFTERLSGAVTTAWKDFSNMVDSVGGVIIDALDGPGTSAKIKAAAEASASKASASFSTTAKTTITDANPVAGALDDSTPGVETSSTKLGEAAGKAFTDALKIEYQASDMVGYWNYINTGSTFKGTGSVENIPNKGDAGNIPNFAGVSGYTIQGPQGNAATYAVLDAAGKVVKGLEQLSSPESANNAIGKLLQATDKYTYNKIMGINQNVLTGNLPGTYGFMSPSPMTGGYGPTGIGALGTPILPTALPIPTELEARQFWKNSVESFSQTTKTFHENMLKHGADQASLQNDYRIAQLENQAKEKAFSDKFGSDALRQVEAGNFQIKAANTQLNAGWQIKSAAYSTETTANNLINGANYAKMSLTTAGSVTSKFLNDAGSAVRIGLNSAGQQIAVIGSVAQKNFSAAGNKWLSDSNTASTTAKAATIDGAKQSVNLWESGSKVVTNQWAMTTMNCDMIQRNSSKDSSLTTTSAATAAAKDTQNGASNSVKTWTTGVDASTAALKSSIASAAYSFEAIIAGSHAYNDFMSGVGGGGGGKVNTSGGANFGGDYADVTCTGTVYVNPLHYSGMYGTGNYNPMTFQTNGPGMSGGGEAPGWMSSSWLSGFAEGGISDRPMLAKVSEGGHREIHLTENNIREFGLNGGGNIQVHVYLDRDELAGSLMTRSIQIARTRDGLNYR